MKLFTSNCCIGSKHCNSHFAPARFLNHCSSRKSPTKMLTNCKTDFRWTFVENARVALENKSLLQIEFCHWNETQWFLLEDSAQTMLPRGQVRSASDVIGECDAITDIRRENVKTTEPKRSVLKRKT